jgi:hypothetical protein
MRNISLAVTYSSLVRAPKAWQGDDMASGSGNMSSESYESLDDDSEDDDKSYDESEDDDIEDDDDE